MSWMFVSIALQYADRKTLLILWWVTMLLFLVLVMFWFADKEVILLAWEVVQFCSLGFSFFMGWLSSSCLLSYQSWFLGRLSPCLWPFWCSFRYQLCFSHLYNLSSQLDTFAMCLYGLPSFAVLSLPSWLSKSDSSFSSFFACFFAFQVFCFPLNLPYCQISWQVW